jgi:hypothetical protein
MLQAENYEFKCARMVLISGGIAVHNKFALGWIDLGTDSRFPAGENQGAAQVGLRDDVEADQSIFRFDGGRAELGRSGWRGPTGYACRAKLYSLGDGIGWHPILGAALV